MRIYLCGAHSSGKSTIARYISTKYNFKMITEVARKVLSERELSLDSLRTDLDVVDSYQKEIFLRQIKEEEEVKDNFVSDRSFDCLAYTAQHSRILAELLRSKDLSKYLDSLRKKDCIIFFVRPSKATLKADGIRESLSWDGIVSIDAQIKLLLEMWELRYFPINTDNMQERIRLVDNVISLLQ
jgi:dephospho-CoA kinase